MDAFMHLARACARREPGPAVHLTVLTNAAQDVTGDEPLDPAAAAFSGAVLVVGQEQPSIRSRAIDVVLGDHSDRILEQLDLELNSAPDDPLVAYRGGYRWVRDFSAAARTARIAACANVVSTCSPAVRAASVSSSLGISPAPLMRASLFARHADDLAPAVRLESSHRAAR